jgi:hypothetical protein
VMYSQKHLSEILSTRSRPQQRISRAFRTMLLIYFLDLIRMETSSFHLKNSQQVFALFQSISLTTRPMLLWDDLIKTGMAKYRWKNSTTLSHKNSEKIPSSNNRQK